MLLLFMAQEIFTTPSAASKKNDTRFISGQRKLKNNPLALLV